MPTTYEPITTQTLGTAIASVTFSSIPQTYTDLVVVINHSGAGDNFYFQLNSDTGSNYSDTGLVGNGTSATSIRNNSQTRAIVGGSYTSNMGVSVINFMNYSNTTTNKTIISRNGTASNVTRLTNNLWRSTAAISTIYFVLATGNFAVGSTFTLYGIKAA